MARFQAQESPLEQIERLIPHIIILIILCFALLVVLTKFQWVHCSQIPGFNWCGTYCTYVEQGKSRIGVLSGHDGLGNPDLLRAKLTRLRGFTLVEPVAGAEFSSGLLKKFDLLVVEHFKTASTRQIDAITGYLDSGGTIIWVADSFSTQTVDEYDLLQAMQKNESYYLSLIAANVTPGTPAWDTAWSKVKNDKWYQNLQNNSAKTGFGVLENYLRARYDGNVNATQADLRIVDIDHLSLRGLKKEFPTESKQFSKVVPDASNVNLIAQVVTPVGSFPGIIETRYAGRVLYVAYPLEQSNSTTLLTNLVDYLAPC